MGNKVLEHFLWDAAAMGHQGGDAGTWEEEGGLFYHVVGLPHGWALRRDAGATVGGGMFGGNSNWRGPIWMPVNGLIIRALLQYYTYYGNGFIVECPTGSGRQMTLYQVAEELTRRLTSIFLRGEDGSRPVYGGTKKFQEDRHWRDYILFYEYFHGDNGAGLGASHQTGWTGLIAGAMHLFATTTPEQALELGKKAALTEIPLKAGGAKAAAVAASDKR